MHLSRTTNFCLANKRIILPISLLFHVHNCSPKVLSHFTLFLTKLYLMLAIVTEMVGSSTVVGFPIQHEAMGVDPSMPQEIHHLSGVIYLLS